METISYKKFIAQLTDKAYREDVPLNGSFELTPLCNLDCKMCYVHLQDPSVRHRMLSGKQWIGLMEQAIGKGMFKAMLTGGEALTHPDFWQIYMYLIEHGVAVHLKTNGLLLDEETIARLVEYPPIQIDVSLYGCDSESYVAVTGVDAFERVSKNIQMAIDAGLQNIWIAVTPSRYMSPWTNRVMEFAKSFGVSVMVNSTLFAPNENTGRKLEDIKISVSEEIKIQDDRKELFPRDQYSDIDSFYGTEQDRPHISDKGLYCKAGRSGFTINWDGIMVPCILFPRNIVCANPLADGFEHAWQAINQGVKEYAVPQQCHSCKYNERCHFCPAAHQKTAALHQCDPDVCTRNQQRLSSLSKDYKK